MILRQETTWLIVSEGWDHNKEDLFFFYAEFLQDRSLKNKSKEAGYSISGMRKLKINQIHPETQKGTKIFLNQKEKFFLKKVGGGVTEISPNLVVRKRKKKRKEKRILWNRKV